MTFYLPIAEMPVSVFMVLAMGGAVGLISGLFGVGGGFLMTPLLIFSGIPPAVAVASVTPQIVASSTSAALTYWRRRQVDFKLAAILIAAGAAGAFAGAELFARLGSAGHLTLVIALSYTAFLATIGSLTLNESVRAMLRARAARKRGEAPPPSRRGGTHGWIHRLPLKVRFRRSRLYISVLPVVGLGLTISFLGTLLGIGGGFIMVPALIYLLKVPTSVVVGTSLVQIVGVMGIATVMHSVASESVDIILAFILMIGGVFGAQIGASMGQALRGEHLRALLGLLVLAVGLRFAFNLVVTPSNLFAITVTGMP
ncbi:sulfite exporter TauE/SafE family protein [Acuticoccus mangrovi]|uniref:Probable membrane transporter protein n=1 Tax=Acuticoccus mangrovi TaxID=2796142 RepID=A0A934MI51_9HYPH|nr:sulfite exporter TauE/SafE family protein [Acuticoccus mangrovi]MBJ3777580.1 sulfite exporter TauE/SafE family protein [Acuticoccus mangrovi]